MAVYDITGSELTAVFDTSGEGITAAYDIDGNEIVIRTPTDITEVVSYYRTDVLAMQQTISGLSDEWENLIFITDPHGTSNEQHSQAIAMYLLSNTPNISKIILNGDYVSDSWDLSEYTTYTTPFLESSLMPYIIATVGNHDVGKDAVVYADFLADKSNLNGVPQGGYFYYDIPSKKLRMMFINTSSNGWLTISQTQLNWIAQNVILPDSTWNLAVFGHVNVDDVGGVCYQNLTNASALISAIGACNGHIVGYFCGHQHIDDTRNIGDFQQTTLLCDRFENRNYYNGLSVTNRVEGTVTEQAVSIISINTTTKNVVVRRIGAGWENIVAGLHYTY